MKNLMTKTLKTLAVAGMTMGLAQGAWAAEAKAVYRTNDGGKKTLTFYYDDKEYSGDGVTQWKFKDYPTIETVEGLRSGNVASKYDGSGNRTSFEIPWVGEKRTNDGKSYYYSVASYVQKVIFDDSFKNYKPKGVSYWFSCFYACEAIEGWENLDLSECLNLQHLFYYCSSFEGPLDFSARELNCVTNLRYTFSFCKKLKGITGLKVPNPTLLVATAAFREDNIIEELDLTRFNTHNCKELDFMFYNDYKLKKIYASPDFGWWDEWMTNNVEGTVQGQQYKTSYMFTNCVELVGGNGTEYEADYEFIGLPPGTRFAPKPCATNRFLIDGWDGRKGYLTARSPSYGDLDGRDWLFNHAIAEKMYENEAAESSVDIFYVYPTLMTDREDGYMHNKGFRLLDDPEMRAMTISTNSSSTSAYGAFWNTGRALADLGRVYAPFYRQATNDRMISAGTKEGEGKELLPGLGTANAALLNMLYHGYGYLDITNALETYFAKWNKNEDGSRRKFILAGHSQGSATLMLALEHYFTQDDAHKDLLKNLVASYQIGMGVDKQWVADLEANTKTAGFDGVKFASTSNDFGVVVSFNTTGETTGEPCASILLPKNPISINPISWTRDDTLADKALNLGSLTNAEPERIVNGLHSAQVNLARGTVESCGFTEAEWAAPTNIFGEASLHGQDYPAFWEDLHKNAYDRITAATGKEPVVGQPTDYADSVNWIAFGDSTTKAGGTDKPFDVFFLYPTAELSPVDYVGDINDDMKAQADAQYAQDVQPLETYANMYAPYYRQLSMFYLFATPDPDGCQQNLARHVGKTDTFAALDYYFKNVNKDGVRPFVLVGHSQGSASLKNIFEQYFTGEKKALLKKMIAAYPVGWVFSTDWCKEYGYTFATGASDTNVVITWNTEGPNVPLPSENYFTSNPNGQAINPLNWATNSTYAPIEANLGSYKNGELVAGGADGQLDPVNRPGALIVTNTTFTSIDDPNLGKETYHITEFAMFRENICDNILQRGKELSGYERIVPQGLPTHVRVAGARAAGEDLTAIGGGYWAVASADSVEVVVTPTNENQKVVFVNGEREMSLPMKSEGGAWVMAMSEAEIAEATKTGDSPKVMLGIVAQRYPWNGTLDIQYKTLYANASVIVTFYANGIKLGEAQGTGGQGATASFDLNAVPGGAFKDKKLKNVKITATIE